VKPGGVKFRLALTSFWNETMTDSPRSVSHDRASHPQGLLVAAWRGLRGALVAALTDNRPAYAWRQGPDHLYQATRSAFGRRG
jgi:hypothetical protein